MKTIKPFEGMVGGLIEREAVTTSLHIAEVFGKQHKNVLRVIENISEEIRGQRNIEPSYYVNSH